MTVIWGNGVGDSTPEAEGGRGNGRACPSINGELGIWVKEPEQNKGYAYRALGEALRYARKHCGNVAFYYEADVRNMGSLRLLDKFADEYEIIPYEPEKVTTDSGKELELRGYELRVK